MKGCILLDNGKLTIDTRTLQLNRKGKADGYLPEIRRGNGIHTPKKHKKKTEGQWKKEVKQYF